MKEQLLIWEPIVGNPFCRKNNEMNLVKLSFEKDFVLVFEDNKSKEMYSFSYESSEDRKAFITFRIVEELVRPDIEELIFEFFNKIENNSLNYGPTFYKVQNSRFLKWYDDNYEIRKVIQPNAEHHLFITSTFIVEVISEVQPVVSKLKQ